MLTVCRRKLLTAILAGFRLAVSIVVLIGFWFISNASLENLVV